MNEEPNKSLIKRVRGLGKSGIAIGVLSILACELPILLAIVGLGGLSSAASIFSLPPMVEMIGVTVGVLGLLLVLGLFAHRLIAKAKS